MLGFSKFNEIVTKKFVFFAVLIVCIIIIIAATIYLLPSNVPKSRIVLAERQIDALAEALEHGEIETVRNILSPKKMGLRWELGNTGDEPLRIDPVPPQLIEMANNLRTRRFKNDNGHRLEFTITVQGDSGPRTTSVYYYTDKELEGVLAQ